MQGKYGNLDATVISYGPCQTPTLTFAVQRHQAITAFQPEDFWSVRPHISKAGQRCDAEFCCVMYNSQWQPCLWPPRALRVPSVGPLRHMTQLAMRDWARQPPVPAGLMWSGEGDACLTRTQLSCSRSW